MVLDMRDLRPFTIDHSIHEKVCATSRRKEIPIGRKGEMLNLHDPQ